MIEQNFDLSGGFTGTPDLYADLARQGFQRRSQTTQLRRAALIEGQALLADAQRGRVDPMLVQEVFQPRGHEYVAQEAQRRYPALIAARETMSISDFGAYLTTDLINVMLWGGFQQSTPEIEMLVKKAPPLTDFRTVKRLVIDGGIGAFNEDKGRQSAPTEEGALTPVDPITYEPKVYAKKMSIDWKALYNDTYGVFNMLTSTLLTSWRITVSNFITNMYWDASGPNASLFKSAYRNLVTTTYGASSNNPPLSFQALADAYTVLLKQQGPEGEPIDFAGRLLLVVPPALAVTAKALKASTQNQLSILGGNQNADGFPTVRLNVNPTMVIPDFDIIVDKRISKVVTSGTVMNTAWLLVYEPSAQNRPTVEMAFLQGFDTPTVWQRVPDTMRAGGGVDNRMGSFDGGQIDYKSVLVMGGAYGDGRSAVASTGQGS